MHINQRFGIKLIGRAVGVNRATVRRALKESGVYNPANSDRTRGFRPPGFQYPITQAKVEAAQVKAWEREFRAHLIGDEATHWGRHAEVKLWRARHSMAAVYKSLSDAEKRIRNQATIERHRLDPSRKEKRKRWRAKAIKSPSFRLRSVLSSRLLAAMRGAKQGRSITAFIGCSIEHLRAYLEAQFTRRMSWANYGRVWQIDHIMPVSSFDHTSDVQVKQCWNWINLRPLTVKENAIKSGRITDAQQQIALTFD